MKNNTSFSNDDISVITNRVGEEYSDIGFTDRKVINIAKKVDNFKFNNDEEKLLALEYITRVKGAITYYIYYMVPIKQKEKYYKKYYNTIDYATNKIISTFYPDESVVISPIDDENLEDIITRIVIDLKIQLDKKSNNNHLLALKK